MDANKTSRGKHTCTPTAAAIMRPMRILWCVDLDWGWLCGRRTWCDEEGDGFRRRPGGVSVGCGAAVLERLERQERSEDGLMASSLIGSRADAGWNRSMVALSVLFLLVPRLWSAMNSSWSVGLMHRSRINGRLGRAFFGHFGTPERSLLAKLLKRCHVRRRHSIDPHALTFQRHWVDVLL